MTLARALHEHPDELRADFQQFYGLDIDDMGRAYTYGHAAALTAQLPRESRTAAAEDPAAAWGHAEALLSRIEYWAHVLAWAKTKDAKHRRNEPKPVKAPRKRKAAQTARPAKSDVRELERFLSQPRKEA